MLFPVINFSPMEWEQEAPVLNLCKKFPFHLATPIHILYNE